MNHEEDFIQRNEIEIELNLNGEDESGKSCQSQDRDLKASFAGLAGNMLEWYDFAIFGYFSDIIGDTFFPPNQNGEASLLESFAVFGLAFLARPLGGLILGQLGDLHGHKRALETSIFYMAFATFAMGCLPTYAMVGWLSPVLLILARLLQGLSVGGQVIASILFTMDGVDVKHWGIWGAAVFAANSVGVVFGSLLASIVRGSLTEDQLDVWGWRVPFLCGILGACPALYLKYKVRKQPVVNDIDILMDLSTDIDTDPIVESEPQINPLKRALSKPNRRAFFAATLTPAVNSAVFFLLFTWLVIYMNSILDPPIPHAFNINTINTVLGGIGLSLFGGWLADQIGDYVKQMVVSATILAVFSPIMFDLIGKGGDYRGIVAFSIQLFLSLFLGTWLGAMVPWLVLITTPEVRLTSLSLGYNIAISVWGGFSPLLATLLVDQISGSAPGYLISAICVLGLIGVMIAPKCQIPKQSERRVHMIDTEDGSKPLLI